MVKLIVGVNDLATTHPELCKEWHPTKNGNLKPVDVTFGSHKKVWWIGKCGHEWEAIIKNRAKGIGCPICSGKQVLAGFNDLESLFPSIAQEWHPTKNGDLKPSEITAYNSRKVWWINKDGFEWQDTINHRTLRGSNAPKMPNHKPIIGVNDLATTHPEVAKEWHPTKNGDLKPTDCSSGSDKKVWWLCPKGHEHLTSISHKITRGGCPICNREKGTSFPEQAILYYLSLYTSAISRYKIDKVEIDIFLKDLNIGFEYDGIAYHSSPEALKKEEFKNQFIKSHNIRLIRIKETSKKEIEIINGTIYYSPNSDYSNINKLILVIFLLIGLKISQNVDVNKDRIKIYQQYLSIEKENSIASKYPELLKEWNYEKNGYLNPEYFSYASGHKVWWKCSKGHEWEAALYSRNQGIGCPFCSGRFLIKGINDLATLYPNLAEEFDVEKNGIKPT
jgi:DNA-directed RNA polymerase subunit RPC12/RpoP